MVRFEAGYKTRLKGPDLNRYNELIRLCGGTDPYELEDKECVRDESVLPNVNIVHIMHYLINTTRSVSMSKMCNYNSSDAYRFCVDGWIQYIKFSKLANGLILCLGEVKHSFSVREKNLKPWVLVKPEGEILTGWCTCKAGCGESCNHLAAILYGIQIAAEKKKSLTCTSVPCYWLPPRLKDVPFAPIRDIDFSSSAVKRKRMISGEQVPHEDFQQRTPVSAGAVSDFFTKLNIYLPTAAVFRVLPEYCDSHVPKSVTISTLNKLFDKAFCDLSLKDLRRACHSIFNDKMKVTLEESLKIEQMTRSQSSCKMWFQVKIGRIGGSSIHSVMTTSINNPSLTSVHRICDPLRPQKKTIWMKMGSDNESLARDSYVKLMKENGHVNFKVDLFGAKIPVEYPFLVASTDGEIYCDCCGHGIVEIKNPKNPNLDDSIVPGEYYDQMQHYLLCLGPKYTYADYYVHHINGSTLKRVYSDQERQNQILEKAESFSRNVVMPELVARYFTSLKNLLQADVPRDYDEVEDNVEDDVECDLICYCQQPREDPVVKCMGKECTFIWFHLRCVSLKRIPKKWLCPECKPSTIL